MNRKGEPHGSQASQMLRQAMSLHQAGRLPEAEALYRRILAADPRHPGALQMLGVLTGQRGDFAEAERLFRSAVTADGRDPGAHFNHGNALLALQRFDEAFEAFGKAVAAKPDFAPAHLNRGNVLAQQKRFAEAIACYDAAVAAQPNYADACCNRGHALEELRRFAEALSDHERALSLDPARAAFHAARANVLHKLRRYEEALDGLAKALALDPRNAEFLYNRGNVLFELKRYDAAFADYDRAFQLRPNIDYLEGDRLFTKLLLCDWTHLAAETARLVTNVRAGRAAVRPFAFLAVESTPALQAQCARTFAQREFPPAPAVWRGEKYRHDKIRIAYLSADFREHPVAYLLAGVFEQHDRTRFETFGLSFAPDEETPQAARIRSALERFIDVREQSDFQVARLLREYEIDIAVDLMGPTQQARPGILAHRAAPLQVLYLGYAGSSGADYIDYLIADRTVIAADEEGHFSEKIVYLPDTYMPADRLRPIAAQTPVREEEGLPKRGFVFCSFNNAYKFAPATFDIWMRLLRSVEGSVLWLPEAAAPGMDRLRREAEARGVDGSRVIFARRLQSNASHLSRYRLADLFLDTAPFGSHSTACDALWAGVPLLTCRGETFAGRVAASLLKAAGMPELVTDSFEEYERLARVLASDSQRLASLRAKLARDRLTCALFDTARFTRHLEAGYGAMWERHQRGAPPESISVPELSSAM
jgi:predicted O-linked N-acetylglucosamine transferase (SPINDLY family)